MALLPQREHFIYKPEAAYGNWLAPDKALPVDSVDIASQRGLILPEVTGFGRGRGIVVPGEKPVQGSIALLAFPEFLGALLKTFLTAVTSTQQAATAAWRHKFTFDDDADLGSFCFEKQYGSAEAQVVKGARIIKLGISAKAKEPCRLSIDVVAQDEAWVGGTWEDATSAPAAVTTPIPYAATIHLPFSFHQGVLKKGGTLALTLGEIIVTGGTVLANVEAAEITVELGSEGLYVLNNTPVVQNLRALGRIITVKVDLDWVGAGNALITDARVLTETVLQLTFVGALIATPYKYEFVVTLPRCVPRPGDTRPPAIQGSHGRRTFSATFEGLMEDVIDRDFGLVIQNGEVTL